MEDQEKIAFKNKLKRWALDQIGQRIAVAREAIDQAQQAANQEEKSSAGDKYETGRAMGHLQKEMHGRQLAEFIRELATLHAVNTDTLYSEGRAGAFLQGETLAFFIAAGLGRQMIDGQTILFISPRAPLAQNLLNKKRGGTFVFNGSPIRLIEVF